jgi:hypothetical protein
LFTLGDEQTVLEKSRSLILDPLAGHPQSARHLSNGAAILGVGGDEVIYVLLDVMYARAPYTVIQRAMHIHPTVAEYLPTVFGELERFV